MTGGHQGPKSGAGREPLPRVGMETKAGETCMKDGDPPGRLGEWNVPGRMRELPPHEELPDELN